MVQGYPFRGKADVLDSYRVVDLKTTSDLKAFHMLQENMDMMYKFIYIQNYLINLMKNLNS